MNIVINTCFSTNKYLSIMIFLAIPYAIIHEYVNGMGLSYL